MNTLSEFLPPSSSLETLLKMGVPGHLEDIFSKSLLNPVENFFKYPGKNIRPCLVELGYRLSFSEEIVEIDEETRRRLRLAGTIVELIHGGSLIVDDIQDDSKIRRNTPTFHLQHGMPLAINAGNWLYFWALTLIKRLDLPPKESTLLLDDILSLMVRAHFGQAVDIGTQIHDIDQDRVHSVCLASMELKTGTLLSLAIRLGCAVGSGKWDAGHLSTLGSKLGIVLQMFDDFGNFAQEKVKTPSKRHEDLYNKRPTWVWSQASLLGHEAYRNFIQAVDHLPHEEPLNLWIAENDFINTLWSEAKKYLSEVRESWTDLSESHPESFEILNQLCHQLEKAYVKKN